MAGKKPTPTAAIIDSQSVRTAEGGPERGYDAGKKVSGRKRHLVVDTLGLVLAVVVHGGHWQDHDGASFVLLRLHERFRRLKVVFADSAYGRNHLPEWVQETLGLGVANQPPTSGRPRIRRLAKALDHRTHLRLDQPLPAERQGL